MEVSVKKFVEPFAIAKVGIGRYEGEVELWNLPVGCKPTFLHIMVRIFEELKQAKSMGFAFYPYLLTTNTRSVLKKMNDKFSSIDIYFVPIQDDIDDWKWGVPDPSLIDWSDKNPPTTVIGINGEKTKIPDCIRLGDSESEYPVLYLDEFEYFKTSEDLILDCTGSRCKNYSTNTPIENSLSSWVSFGVFQNASGTKVCRPMKLNVVAKAKLVPPFLGDVMIES